MLLQTIFLALSAILTVAVSAPVKDHAAGISEAYDIGRYTTSTALSAPVNNSSDLMDQFEQQISIITDMWAISDAFEDLKDTINAYNSDSELASDEPSLADSFSKINREYQKILIDSNTHLNGVSTVDVTGQVSGLLSSTIPTAVKALVRKQPALKAAGQDQLVIDALKTMLKGHNKLFATPAMDFTKGETGPYEVPAGQIDYRKVLHDSIEGRIDRIRDSIQKGIDSFTKSSS